MGCYPLLLYLPLSLLLLTIITPSSSFYLLFPSTLLSVLLFFIHMQLHVSTFLIKGVRFQQGHWTGVIASVEKWILCSYACLKQIYSGISTISILKPSPNVYHTQCKSTCMQLLNITSLIAYFIIHAPVAYCSIHRSRSREWMLYLPRSWPLEG